MQPYRLKAVTVSGDLNDVSFTADMTELKQLQCDVYVVMLYTDLMVLLCSTCAFLMRHLSRMASLNDKTGMTCKNLAIVWAPNLLRYSTYLKIVIYMMSHYFKDYFCIQVSVQS